MKETTAKETDRNFDGIDFKLITEDLISPVLDLMWTEYIPEDPLSRSLGERRSWLSDQLHIYDHLVHGGGVVAVRDGQVVGYRCGKVVNRTNWLDWLLSKLLGWIALSINWISRDFFWSTSVKLKLEKALDSSIWSHFTRLNCSSIYEDRGVCVSASDRGKGLGAELVRRGELVAKWLGCEYTVNVSTSDHSARIFDKLGYTRLKEVQYSNFRDESGNLYLNDTGKNTRAVNFIKVIN